MNLLEVRAARSTDVYRDIIRVPEEKRKDCEGNKIKEGTVCEVSVHGSRVFAVLRGNIAQKGDNAGRSEAILIDEFLREKLGVNTFEEHQFCFKKASYLEHYVFAWKAADSGYRISMQLGGNFLFYGSSLVTRIISRSV